MHLYALFRILIVGFFLYMARPYLLNVEGTIEFLFWSAWLLLALLILGANLATLLQITHPPLIEQEQKQERKTLKY